MNTNPDYPPDAPADAKRALLELASTTLRPKVRAGFVQEIEVLTARKPGGLSKKSAGDIIAGWDDGWRCAVLALVAAGWHPAGSGCQTKNENGDTLSGVSR